MTLATRRLAALAGAAAALAATLVVSTPTAGATALPVVPSPSVTGPIPATAEPGSGGTRDHPFLATPIDLAARGYVEEEFFVSGTACRYALPTSVTGSATVRDCGWPYTTRVLVRRPAAPEAFNGTVLAEWQNVTAQYDVDHYWLESSEHIMRSGYAWVGVSAQRAGIQPLPPPANPATSVNTLKVWSPTRYGSLDVTAGGRVVDDGLRFDIFSQAVQALRSPATTSADPLGPLDPTTVIALGTSQSGTGLASYHNFIWALSAPVVDAFFIGESRADVRADLAVPVLRLLSEVDAAGQNVGGVFVPGPLARADRDFYRQWEVAGSSHADFGFISNIQPLLARDQVVTTTPVCSRNPLSRIPKRYVYHAAWDQLTVWAQGGAAPPVAPRISFVDTDPGLGVSLAIERDADGNALGGIRLSEHSVPTAYNGTGNGGGLFCNLFGVNEPFTPQRLAQLYRNHGRYVSSVSNANEANVLAGFLLPADSDESTSNAARSEVGRR